MESSTAAATTGKVNEATTGGSSSLAEEVPALLTEEMAKVVVSNVYNGGSTVEMDMHITDTIGVLKNRLCESLAEKPAPSEQRLIYCGKICRDDQVCLREVLRDLESPQTFHLVLCKEKRQGEKEKKSQEQYSGRTNLPNTSLRNNNNYISRQEDGMNTSRQDQILLQAALDVRKTFVVNTTTQIIYEEALRNGGWTARLMDNASQNARFLSPLNNTIPQQDYSTTRQNVAVRNDLVRESRLAAHIQRVVRQFQSHPLVASFDIKLFIKLAVIVALLGHDSQPRRFIMLAIFAFIAYCIQTGVARLILNSIFGRDNLHFLHRGTNVFGDVQQDTAENTSAAFFFNLFLGHIPTSNSRPFGFFFELGIFFATFFISLAPPWRPRAAAPQEETSVGGNQRELHREHQD